MSAEEVTRAMHGDHDAFAALIDAAANRLYALACLILRDLGRAEDATQEAFVRAWREAASSPRCRPVRCMAPPPCRNACYDEGRRVHRRAQVSLLKFADRS